jgi:hypothetical protein
VLRLLRHLTGDPSERFHVLGGESLGIGKVSHQRSRRPAQGLLHKPPTHCPTNDLGLELLAQGIISFQTPRATLGAFWRQRGNVLFIDRGVLRRGTSGVFAVLLARLSPRLLGFLDLLGLAKGGRLPLARPPRLLQRGCENLNLLLLGADHALQFFHPRPEAAVLLDQSPFFRVHHAAKITPFPSSLPRPFS